LHLGVDATILVGFFSFVVLAGYVVFVPPGPLGPPPSGSPPSDVDATGRAAARLASTTAPSA
jgi:hypothetical protein